MDFEMAHIGINVLDLDRSVKFYSDAFGLREVFRMHPKSELDMILCFLSDERSGTMLTLCWYGERQEPYDMGENNVHIAFVSDDLAASCKRHQEMGIVCIENLKKDIYYVEDPDGYQIAVVPKKYHPIFVRERSGRKK